MPAPVVEPGADQGWQKHIHPTDNESWYTTETLSTFHTTHMSPTQAVSKEDCVFYQADRGGVPNLMHRR